MSTQPTNKEVESDSQLKYEILPDDYTQYDLSFKIIVIGDSGVGKSCLTNKATNNIFEENYNATVGFEFFTFNIKMFNKIIKLQIWDTCGQEAYRALISSFYKNSSLAILVYAIDSVESFNNLEIWLNDIKTQSNPDIKIILIGNKFDLEDRRQVEKEMGENFCKENELSFFMETSAKSGHNVINLFNEAAKILYEKYKEIKEMKNKKNSPYSNTNSEPIIICDTAPEDNDKNRKKCIC